MDFPLNSSEAASAAKVGAKGPKIDSQRSVDKRPKKKQISTSTTVSSDEVSEAPISLPDAISQKRKKVVISEKELLSMASKQQSKNAQSAKTKGKRKVLPTSGSQATAKSSASVTKQPQAVESPPASAPVLGQAVPEVTQEKKKKKKQKKSGAAKSGAPDTSLPLNVDIDDSTHVDVQSGQKRKQSHFQQSEPESKRPKIDHPIIDAKYIDSHWDEILHAMLSLPTSPDPSGFITLPNGLRWPYIEHQSLFVRSFYADCVEKVMGMFKPSCVHDGLTVDKFSVFGNAGIGKTAFALYALFRAVHAGCTVVLHSKHFEAEVVLFHQGQAYSFLDQSLCGSFLKDPTTVFISDSLATSPSVPAFTILTSSLDPAEYSNFEKSPRCVRLTFPCWSKEELHRLQPAFPSVSPLQLDQSFALCGGIPRLVFLSKTERIKQLLQFGIFSISNFHIFHHAMKQVADIQESNPSHRLLVYKTKGEMNPEIPSTSLEFYEPQSLELCSSFVTFTLFHRALELSDLENSVDPRNRF